MAKTSKKVKKADKLAEKLTKKEKNLPPKSGKTTLTAMAASKKAPAKEKSNKTTKKPVSQLTENKVNKNNKQSKSDNVPEMFLAKIKDGYLFKSDSKGREHIFVVYKDVKTKEVRAVETTHLYEPSKVKKIKRGFLKEINFEGFEYPSAINNNYFNKDIEKNKLDLKNKNIVLEKKPLAKEKAKLIYEFASKPRK